MTERFLRSEMLLGPAALEKLARSHVCVVGLGGVGSWAAECLARAGVGLSVWTVNDGWELSWFLGLGVRNITTRRPVLALELREGGKP